MERGATTVVSSAEKQAEQVGDQIQCIAGRKHCGTY